MINRHISLSLILLMSLGLASAQTNPKLNKAISLYELGMYESARIEFEGLPKGSLSQGYILLCDIAVGCSELDPKIVAYEQQYPSSTLLDRIRFENARFLFDEQRYAEASLEFHKVSTEILSNNELQEYSFKCGYCAYQLDDTEQALQAFSIVDAMGVSDYSSTAQYLSGIIYYNQSLFAQAEKHFWNAVKDKELSELASFYIVDCEFNLKNYAYAISEGEKLYGSASPERQKRLARIISEASLIEGDTAKAKQYFEDLSDYRMNRKDYFYAGTVLYTVRDYRGAIEKYSQMGELSDSLGQIAAYHMGNAYLRTHNQVAAMDNFKIAAYLDYDAKMREDACFNYAKLAFDLNKDSSGFSEYIRRYSTRTRGEQIYSYMALASLVDRDYQAALDAYDHIDELSADQQSNYCKANFLRATQLFEHGSYTAAIPYFRVCSYYLPKTSKLGQYSRYWLAEAQYRIGNYAEAQKAFTELYNNSALVNSKEGNILAYNVAYSYFKASEYETARRWFDVYIATRNPDYRYDALCRRADCDFGLRDYNAAINSYQKVLFEFESPDEIYPYYQQALSYGLTGKKDKKITTLRRVEQASANSPLYFEAWYELGKALMDNKKNAEAIASFKHLQDFAKDNVWKAKALAGLGMVYRNAAEYNKSLESYKAIVTLMPSSQYAEEALLAIESIYQKLKKPQKYLEYLEQNALSASKSEAEKEKMYFNTAEQLYMDGSYNDALASLTKFIESYPNSVDVELAKFYMAESYRSLGELEKACAYYAQAKDSKSEHSFVEMSKLRYAEISYTLERFQDAYKGYKELSDATKFDSNKSLAAIGMMRSAFRSRDYAAADVAASLVANNKESSDDLVREANYLRAKSKLALSQRDQAIAIFKTLAAQASTPEGAEANYFLIQNNFDTAQFELVENQVYQFSQKAGDQSYWLARAYIVLADSFVQRGQIEQAKATYESIRDGYVPAKSQDDILHTVTQRLDKLAQ